MRRPSTALRHLEDALAVLPGDTVLTASRLGELVADAARQAEDFEHDDYMGEDQ